MEGYLGKKGKRMGSRVKRYMRLDGAVLSNHHSAGAPPSWRVNVKDASISSNPKRHKVVIELYNNKLELYTDSTRECTQWYEALRNAKKKAHLSARGEDKENGEARDGNIVNADIFDLSKTMSGAVEDREGVAVKARAELGKNFKVVKPPSRYTQSADSSDGSDEAYEGEGRLVVQGQVYEETPASMIFKQFTFPAK